ncbi:MAG: nitroreductase [Rhizobiales bacterium]|nr:nitroreductase [Hyphomicrobiales bacterium]
MTRFNDTSSLLAFLKSRKSASAKAMTGPGPTPAQLREILALAVRVPDHGKLAPWRFISFTGEARARIGDKFAARWKELHPDHGDDSLAFMKGFMMRAPVVVAVVSRAATHPKIPLWEQQMSAGALAFNVELAAQAHGFDATWITDWVAYDDAARKMIGLVDNEHLTGLIFIGKASAPLEDRPRPDVDQLLTEWSG